MGWRVRRPRIKIAKGLYLNLNKSGISLSARGKHFSQTTNLKTGVTRTTVRTPISGLSYSTTSKGKKSNPKRVIQEETVYPIWVYKVCRFIAYIFAAFSILLGIALAAVGEPVFLIFFLPPGALLLFAAASCSAHIKRLTEPGIVNQQNEPVRVKPLDEK